MRNRTGMMAAAVFAAMGGGTLPGGLTREALRKVVAPWAGTKRAGRTGPRPARCDVHGIKISQRTDAWGHVLNWCRDCQGAQR